jgi:hypothetical protein
MRAQRGSGRVNARGIGDGVDTPSVYRVRGQAPTPLEGFWTGSQSKDRVRRKVGGPSVHVQSEVVELPLKQYGVGRRLLTVGIAFVMIVSAFLFFLVRFVLSGPVAPSGAIAILCSAIPLITGVVLSAILFRISLAPLPYSLRISEPALTLISCSIVASRRTVVSVPWTSIIFEGLVAQSTGKVAIAPSQEMQATKHLEVDAAIYQILEGFALRFASG